MCKTWIWTLVLLDFVLSFSLPYRIRVLFTFDKHFYKDFDGLDGKSAEEHMEEVTRLVTNAYKDKKFKREIGTHVNIIANKVHYDVPL